MATITFDTHKFVRTLKDAGVPESQAETELAAQHDINDLRRDIEARFIQTEQRLIIKLGTLIAVAMGVVAALVKLL